MAHPQQNKCEAKINAQQNKCDKINVNKIRVHQGKFKAGHSRVSEKQDNVTAG